MKPENQERWNKLISMVEEPKRKLQLANLVEYLEANSAYFTAPASPRYHNDWEEGLLEHSMNVAENALKINRALNAGINGEELIIAGLFHDLGKAYIEDNQPYYLIKEATDKQKQYGYVPDPAFEYNQAGQVFMTVPQRAVRLITQFIDISDACYQAILIHDGQYVEENKPYGTKESPFALILHYADSWAGFAMESIRKQGVTGKNYERIKPDRVGRKGYQVRESQTGVITWRQ